MLESRLFYMLIKHMKVAIIFLEKKKEPNIGSAINAILIKSHHDVDNHFTDIGKMVKIGSDKRVNNR